MTNHPADTHKTAYLQIVRSAMLGHAIADAMGVPVEFSDRSDRRRDPVTGYRGYGAHDVPAAPGRTIPAWRWRRSTVWRIALTTRT